MVFVLLVASSSNTEWFSQTWKLDGCDYKFTGSLYFPKSDIILYCESSSLAINSSLGSQKIFQKNDNVLYSHYHSYSECEDLCKKDCEFLETWVKGGYNLTIISIVIYSIIALSIVIFFYSFIRGQGNYLAFMDFRLSAIVFTTCAIVQIVGFLLAKFMLL